MSIHNRFVPGVSPTYKEQFDKLTRAYINNEVEPWECKACFVGNLLNNKSDWRFCRSAIDLSSTIPMMRKDCPYLSVDTIRKEGRKLYSLYDIASLEAFFLHHLTENGGTRMLKWTGATLTETEENALFTAFEKTLEMLKEMHISKGEVIEETPVFTKREVKKHEEVTA